MKKKTIRKIGVVTAGGDCPGLNAVLRSVVKTAFMDYGVAVVGVKDGFHGLIYDHVKQLSFEDVSGILTRGGTLIGASNKDDPFHEAVQVGKKWMIQNCQKQVFETVRKNELDALVVVGGDGSLKTAHKLSQLGLPVVGIPKTIDNDVAATDVTVGFSTAVATATEAIDKINTTALSHHRIMVIELMGRYAGWLALFAGVASGSDVILLPELPYDLNVIDERVKERSHLGRRFSIVVVSEGARPKHGKWVVRSVDYKRTDPLQLGGVGGILARQIEERTGLETRVTVLGHLVRGGNPNAEDRLLATQFGKMAVDSLMRCKFGQCVVMQQGGIKTVPLSQAVSKLKCVPRHHPLILAAKSVGTSFGA